MCAQPNYCQSTSVCAIHVATTKFSSNAFQSKPTILNVFFYFPYIIFDQLLISPYKKFMIGCFNKFKFTGGLAWTCIWIYLFMVRMYLNLFKDMFEFDEDVLNLCMDLFDFKLIIIITKLVWLILWVDVYIININRSFKNKGFKLLLCDNLFSFAPASLFLGEII
jgi:hypothetical protein